MNVITGAGGFIGRALWAKLKSGGVDPQRRLIHVESGDNVFHLAADTGGIGYVHNDPGRILSNNLALDLDVLRLCRETPIARLFYTSSACVYPWYNERLKEDMVHPADPDGAIGWAKLTGEKLFLQSGLDVRIGRLHSIYGPGCRLDKKEKFVTALCRKVALAKDGDSVEVWGDGTQIRTFTYIDDCVDGILALMNSDLRTPANIGSEEAVMVNELAQMVIEASGKDLRIQNIPGPVGPEFRVPDSSLLKAATGWYPKTPLRQGILKTYAWVEEQLNV